MRSTEVHSPDLVTSSQLCINNASHSSFYPTSQDHSFSSQSYFRVAHRPESRSNTRGPSDSILRPGGYGLCLDIADSSQSRLPMRMHNRAFSQSLQCHGQLEQKMMVPQFTASICNRLGPHFEPACITPYPIAPLMLSLQGFLAADPPSSGRTGRLVTGTECCLLMPHSLALH